MFSTPIVAEEQLKKPRRLSDHLYFRQHLLHYAVACFGPPKLPHEDHEFILMVVVDMVAVSAAKPTGQKRTTVKNIVAIPACIVPDEVLDTQRTLLKSMRDPRPVHSMWISTTGIYPKGEECRFRLNTVIADEIFMSASKLPNFSVDLYSHSYGLFRRVNVDRDFIFQSINDELRLDTNNHYQLEA
ncbi:hypothetical protein B0H16DRAFT_1718288 [Mycena metata]|uniref:Uncharacterized protein n=1 Tax=Mycena metata TaxID=1033252 RepID=A0AAD7NKM2_9AGAR|nr:hypothetical protein B0H16DRAFT_1718288 [Mycena metata]